MANIDINARVIDNVKNDDIVSILNSIIDDELQKDVSLMNTELIDECVNALLQLEKEDNQLAALIPLMGSDDFLQKIQPKLYAWKNMNVFLRAGIIASIIASTTFTANAAYEKVTGVNVLGNITTSIQSKLIDWGLIKDEQEELIPVKKTEESTTAPIREIEEDDEIKVKPVVKTKSNNDKTTNHGIENLNGDDDEKPTDTGILNFNGDDDETPTDNGIDQLNDDDDENTTESGIDQFEGDDDEIEDDTSRKPEPTTEEPVAPAKPESDEVVFKGLSVEYDDNFKLDYIYGEKLSYDGIKLTAIYSNGNREPVSLNDCSYTKSVNMNVTADYTLRIIYKNCVVKIDITVRPDDETRGSQICENDLFDYLLTKKGAYITKYKGNETNIDLDKIDGYGVYAIAAQVFKGTDITDFTSDTVIKVFDSAFKDCSELVSCYTPRAEYIGNNAFENCVKLPHPVFSDYITHLGTAAYKNSGIEELLIKNNLVNISDELCENCSKLKALNLCGAEKIGKYAFSECTALASVLGTANIKEAEDFAFYNCSEAVFDEKPTALHKAGENAFAYCHKVDFGKLSIDSVDKYAFAYCYLLSGAEISGDIRVVPEGAFRGSHMTELILNEGTEEIYDTAFMSTSIVTVHLPSTLKSIGTYGLYSIKLREVYCNKALEEIGTSAFFKSKLKLYVFENTYAHTYAVENDINYELI
ncbi:MAG: leucine-rich repeat protein [Eubacterium sp.]|nr:leucine-rich repeat protein [Eubacterium sp.]